MAISCIYKWTNIINGKIYIGHTCDFVRRKREHKKNNISKKQSYLQKAFIKHGIENFQLDIIQYVKPIKKDLKEAEQFWLDYFKSYEREVGYNISRYSNATGPFSEDFREQCRIRSKENFKGFKNIPNNKGRKHTEETKKLLSISLKTSEKFQKSVKDPERRRKISENNKGKKRSPEQIIIMKESFKGKTKEKYPKISEVKIGNKNPMFGKIGELSATSKKILQYTLDDKFIKEWSSIKEAELFYNIPKGKLSAYIKGTRKNKTNYNWKYKDGKI